jgi:hypothetical protein
LSNPAPELTSALRAFRKPVLTPENARPSRPKPTIKRIHQPTESELAAMVAAYERGDNVLQIARAIGIGRSRTARLLKEQGVRVNLRAMTIADCDEAVRRYGEGQSLAEIGQALGRDGETIRLRLLSRGVQVREPW